MRENRCVTPLYNIYCPNDNDTVDVYMRDLNQKGKRWLTIRWSKSSTITRRIQITLYWRNSFKPSSETLVRLYAQRTRLYIVYVLKCSEEHSDKRYIKNTKADFTVSKSKDTLSEILRDFRTLNSSICSQTLLKD